MIILYVVALIILLICPYTRAYILHPFLAVYYTLYDIVDYIVHKKWKLWNGYGIKMYIGLFGKGKTLSAVHYVVKSAKKYKLNVLSNIKLSGIEYTPLVNYQQIIDAPADTIVLIDEISTLWNAREWQSFNISLLFQILQCRKNRKELVCTAQRFQHVDKLLRDVTSYVIDCRKFFRAEINTYYDAWDYENISNPRMLKPLKRKCWFIRNRDFNSYDTSEIIDNYKKMDFLENKEILENKGGIETSVYNVSHVSKKFKKRRG